MNKFKLLSTWGLILLFLMLSTRILAEEEAPAEEPKEAEPAEEEKKAEGEDKKEDEGGKEGEDKKEEGDKKDEEKPEEAANGEALKCNQEVLKTYGMEGLAKPKEMALDMCTHVSMSCCSHQDQAKIYENWETNKESEKLKKRFHYHTRVGFYKYFGIKICGDEGFLWLSIIFLKK